MKKYCMIFMLAAICSGTAFAQFNSKDMKSDFSENMIDKKTQEATYLFTIKNGENLIYEGKVNAFNGEILPIITGSYKNEIEQFNNAMDKAENSKGQTKELETGFTSFQIRFAWHTDGTNNIWTQFFIEDFKTNVKIDTLGAEVKGKKEESLNVIPKTDRTNYDFTVASLNKQETYALWNNYSFKFKPIKSW